MFTFSRNSTSTKGRHKMAWDTCWDISASYEMIFFKFWTWSPWWIQLSWDPGFLWGFLEAREGSGKIQTLFHYLAENWVELILNSTCLAQTSSVAGSTTNVLKLLDQGPKPPIYIHLILEISSLKNLVWQTGCFVYSQLDFYCLCSMQKSSSK